MGGRGGRGEGKEGGEGGEGDDWIEGYFGLLEQGFRKIPFCEQDNSDNNYNDNYNDIEGNQLNSPFRKMVQIEGWEGKGKGKGKGKEKEKEKEKELGCIWLGGELFGLKKEEGIVYPFSKSFYQVCFIKEVHYLFFSNSAIAIFKFFNFF